MNIKYVHAEDLDNAINALREAALRARNDQNLVELVEYEDRKQ